MQVDCSLFQSIGVVSWQGVRVLSYTLILHSMTHFIRPISHSVTFRLTGLSLRLKEP